MAEQHESKLHQYGAVVQFWWKVISAVVGFAAMGGVLWTQFLGPGVKPAFQDFVGVNEVIQRLEFVEQFMPAPRVVEWNESAINQIGSCTSKRCLYVLNGSRTEYGEGCGKPDEATPFLRTAGGQNVQITFDGFKPIELTREPTSFTIPLSVPSYVPAGDHQFRVRIVYPTCPGTREPIPRWTPWFPLRVEEP